MDNKMEEVVASVLGSAGNNLAQELSTKTLDDVSFHDFLKFEILLEPNSLNHKYNLEQLSEEGVNYIDDLESSGASEAVLGYTAAFLVRLETGVKKACEEAALQDVEPNTLFIVIAFIKAQAINIAIELITPLYLWYRPLIRRLMRLDRNQTNILEDIIFGSVRANYKQLQMGDSEFTLAKTINQLIPENRYVIYDDKSEYPFDIYPAGTVNVGIAKIFRQRWKTIGIQPGEIIKTIPLAPGQSEKVITKITRRKKTTSSRESSVESEISQDYTDTTKTSSDIINEVASEEGWSISGEASYGVGGVGWGASISGEQSGSRAVNNKTTTSSLSEKMKKTASKMRSQSKVIVTTEFESSFEETVTSEVNNTNDEVPLTLEYHMLQHLYDVYTYLQSVKNVIYVAEKIPTPNLINKSWVRAHDWIIAEVLINESFRDTLNELIQDIEDQGLVNFSSATNPYATMRKEAQDKFAAFNSIGNPEGIGGINVPDIYAEPQRQYDEFRKNEELRKKANKLRKLRQSRLFDHIRHNILHYCQAIWAKENNEQRMLRYKKEGRTVPAIWKGPSIVTDQEISHFHPTEARVSIENIINNIEPLGYSGNYVVFEITPPEVQEDDLVDMDTNTPDGQVSIPLRELLDILRSKYTNNEGTGLLDPALTYFIEEAEGLSFETIPDETVFDFISYLPHLTDFLLDVDTVLRKDDGKLKYSISEEEWGEYQFKKNATRRFLVDSNNLYISLFLGNGVALEPFKRAHRFIDVLKADEDRKAEVLKNERRDLLKNEAEAFDPDISKVVVVSGSAKPEDIVGGVIDEEETPDGG